MKYIKLNNNWDAEPSVPFPTIKIVDRTLKLSFVLNHFIHKNISDGAIGELTFKDCLMYRLGSPNDEGFFLNQFRFTSKDIPWGGFYELFESNWKDAFPNDKIFVAQELKNSPLLHHFLLFFRDETFECIAKSWDFVIKS